MKTLFCIFWVTCLFGCSTLSSESQKRALASNVNPPEVFKLDGNRSGSSFLDDKYVRMVTDAELTSPTLLAGKIALLHNLWSICSVGSGFFDTATSLDIGAVFYYVFGVVAAPMGPIAFEYTYVTPAIEEVKVRVENNLDYTEGVAYKNLMEYMVKYEGQTCARQATRVKNVVKDYIDVIAATHKRTLNK